MRRSPRIDRTRIRARAASSVARAWHANSRTHVADHRTPSGWFARHGQTLSCLPRDHDVLNNRSYVYTASRSTLLSGACVGGGDPISGTYGSSPRTPARWRRRAESCRPSQSVSFIGSQCSAGRRLVPSTPINKVTCREPTHRRMPNTHENDDAGMVIAGCSLSSGAARAEIRRVALADVPVHDGRGVVYSCSTLTKSHFVGAHDELRRAANSRPIRLAPRQTRRTCTIKLPAKARPSSPITTPEHV